jgi:3',5'-cyclic AMP phosphodiesterase CpdA
MSKLLNPEPVIETGINRRRVLSCMAWAGAGVLWTVSGGVPRSLLIGEAIAAGGSLTFAQISDTHIGFNKDANPHPENTMTEAVARIRGAQPSPSFVLHTGDITHLSKPDQFDAAQQIIKGIGSDVHYVPGEHDWLDDGKAYMDRHGAGTKGDGWYSFDAQGVHFIALVNVVGFKAGALSSLGGAQLAWLKDDVSGLSASTPIVVFAHIPLWAVYPNWGWGTQDSAEALSYLSRFGSVTVLNGHIHQVLQKVEGNVAFHTAMSTAYPQPAPGAAASPGPLKLPADKLRTVLGVREVAYVEGQQSLALTDATLSA